MMIVFVEIRQSIVRAEGNDLEFQKEMGENLKKLTEHLKDVKQSPCFLVLKIKVQRYRSNMLVHSNEESLFQYLSQGKLILDSYRLIVFPTLKINVNMSKY